MHCGNWLRLKNWAKSVFKLSFSATKFDPGGGWLIGKLCKSNNLFVWNSICSLPCCEVLLVRDNHCHHHHLISFYFHIIMIKEAKYPAPKAEQDRVEKLVVKRRPVSYQRLFQSFSPLASTFSAKGSFSLWILFSWALWSVENLG